MAFRVDNGDQAWQRPTSGVQQPAPAIANGQLLAFGDKQTVAVVATNGETRWATQMTAGRAGGDATTLLLASRPGGSVSQLTAVDPTSGATVWNDTIQAQELSLPTLAPGTIFLGLERTGNWASPDNGAVEAIDATAGSTRWTSTRRDAVLAQPQPTPMGLLATSADSPLFCD